MSQEPNAAPNRLKKLLIRGSIGLVGLFVAMQLVPVAAKENPPSQPPMPEKAEAVAIIKRACFDCHSHEVKWPWYSRIAPVSWLVARDVIDGRKGINFSEWPEDKDDQQFNREAVWDSVKDGSMPLWFYTPLHPEAKLSDADKEVLKTWAESSAEEEEEADEGEGDKDEKKDAAEADEDEGEKKDGDKAKADEDEGEEEDEEKEAEAKPAASAKAPAKSKKPAAPKKAAAAPKKAAQHK